MRQRLWRFQRNLWISMISRRGHGETSTAARILRVRQNSFRKIPTAAAPSFSFDAANNAVSEPARSRRRSGMRGAARMQRASRNLQSSLPHRAARTDFFEDRHPKASTISRDQIRRSRLAALSRADFWRDNRACIRAVLSRKRAQYAARAETCKPRDRQSLAARRNGPGAPPRFGEYAPPVSWTNR